MLRMVEALRVKHPQFAARLQAAAIKQGVTIKDIQTGMKCTYEMARRYWLGIAKPTQEAKRIKLAAIVGADPAELEYGAHARTAAQNESQYVVSSPGALDVAKAWAKLSPAKQQLYRDAIFRDAATENLLPWLKLGRPTKENYEKFEAAVVHDYNQHIKQLKLDI